MAVINTGQWPSIVQKDLSLIFLDQYRGTPSMLPLLYRFKKAEQGTEYDLESGDVQQVPAFTGAEHQAMGAEDDRSVKAIGGGVADLEKAQVMKDLPLVLRRNAGIKMEMYLEQFFKWCKKKDISFETIKEYLVGKKFI